MMAQTVLTPEVVPPEHVSGTLLAEEPPKVQVLGDVIQFAKLSNPVRNRVQHAAELCPEIKQL